MSDQKENVRRARRPRPRLESLSDLIYGLSLSIGAISLVVGNGQSQASLGEINRNIVQFVFVFLVLITSWLIYTSDMSVLPVETRLVAGLNVALLVLVVIIPYLFDQVVSTSNPSEVQNYASFLFTLDLAGTIGIMATFAHVIALEEHNLVEEDVMVRFRNARDRMIVLIVILLGSLAIPWEWTILTVPVRALFWTLPILSFWFNRMRQYPGGPAVIRTAGSKKEEAEVSAKQ